jgi:hypothetical protein
MKSLLWLPILLCTAHVAVAGDVVRTVKCRPGSDHCYYVEKPVRAETAWDAICEAQDQKYHTRLKIMLEFPSRISELPYWRKDPHCEQPGH